MLSLLHLVLLRGLRIVARPSPDEASKDIKIAVLRHQFKVMRRQIPVLRCAGGTASAASRLIPESAGDCSW